MLVGEKPGPTATVQVTKGWDHDPPAKEKLVPFGILMLVDGRVDLVLREAGDERRLGGCLADVVAAGSGSLRDTSNGW